jgi:ABC-2 type transport system permease protein
MSIILKIAKNELRNLFYSPVAWFLAIIFLIQCAYFYMSALYPIAITQDAIFQNVPNPMTYFGGNLTGAIFLVKDGVINNVFQNLYLFIPLLTMGLLSREVNSGTIKLLYSSPIKIRQLVLGKYLAVMGYNLVLLGILGFFIVSGFFHIKSMDIGLLLSAELGFYLLVCAYSAIGLFMSSLSTYQIVSGIATFTTFFILSRIGALWQQYDFVRDLTWFLSIAGRTESMLRGLITTKDVLYFLIVIGMFLSFTLFRLKGQRESRPWGIKALRYFSVIVVGVLLGYVTSRPTLVGYLDTTAPQSNTIAVNTQKILKETGKEPMEITLYGNLFGEGLQMGLPVARNLYLSTLWEPYLRFKPDINFKYAYYYDKGKWSDSAIYKVYPHKTLKQIAGVIAGMQELDSSIFMPPEDIRKKTDPDAENLRLFMTVKYKGDSVNLRTYNDSYFWPKQQEIASKLKRLVEGNIPKIYYLTGDLERNIHKRGEREYSVQSLEKGFRESLLNQGFNVDTLSLEKQDIPSNATGIVLADPKTALRPVTLDKLKAYISKGGNLLILGEPGKQAILNPVLSQLGVQLRNGQLVQINKEETPDKVVPYITDDGLRIAPPGGGNLKYKHERKINDTAFVNMMAGAAALSFTENGSFSIMPLLKTYRKEVWLKTGHLVSDSVPPVFNQKEGDIKEPSFVTAVQLTRQINNHQQKIIVCGDADFMSNVRSGSNVFGNVFYSWFDEYNYPVFIPELVFNDKLLAISAPTARVFKMVYVWVLPGLVLLAAIVLLVRRKRK